MNDIKERAEHYRIRIHRGSRAHYLAAKRNKTMHMRFGVPVVVLSTIVGSAIIKQGASNRMEDSHRPAVNNSSCVVCVTNIFQAF